MENSRNSIPSSDLQRKMQGLLIVNSENDSDGVITEFSTAENGAQKRHPKLHRNR